jgi:hypothetical protein
MLNKVLNILDSEGYKEQSQVDFFDNASGNPKESQLATKICTSVDLV